MNKIIIDLEFTGLDNSFITDNEIVCLKLLNLTNNKYVVREYRSHKQLGLHVKKLYGVSKLKGKLFSKEEFNKALKSINCSILDQFIGFSNSTDIKMLNKYSLKLDILDVQEQLMLSKYEFVIATEGRSLENIYYLLFKKYVNIDHSSTIDELNAISDIYFKQLHLKKSRYLVFVPYGPYAGMSIDEYVESHRRAADGYRCNNNDLYSRSLDNAIPYDEFNDY